MKDEDIDLSDIPEVPPEMIARGTIRRGLKPIDQKERLTLLRASGSSRTRRAS